MAIIEFGYESLTGKQKSRNNTRICEKESFKQKILL